VRLPRRSRQRGGTAVEFALVFPLFFALVAGAIEGGRFVVSRMMLSYAVSVGARAATLANATGGNTGTVAAAVVAAAPMLHLDPNFVEISTLSGGSLVALTLPAAVNTPVTVSVGVTNSAHKYQFTSFFPSKFSPFSTRSWSAQATMTVR
jgi:Flp pilus assembly protein TadG